MVGTGLRSSPTASTTSAMTTSTDTYLRNTRIDPNGRMVRAVVTPPASRMQAQRGRRPPVSASSPAEMTSNSNTAQPKHCTMFNTVGSTEALAPSSPRSNTMAGAPVFAPSTRETPRITPPSADPTTIAVTAAGRLNGSAPIGVRIDSAPAKPSRLTPRFPQKPSWSSRPRVRGADSVNVRGASAGPPEEDDAEENDAEADDSACGNDRDMADCLSLRRYEPDQVQAVGDRPCATRVATSNRPLSPVGSRGDTINCSRTPNDPAPRRWRYRRTARIPGHRGAASPVLPAPGRLRLPAWPRRDRGQHPARRPAFGPAAGGTGTSRPAQASASARPAPPWPVPAPARQPPSVQGPDSGRGTVGAAEKCQGTKEMGRLFSAIATGEREPLRGTPRWAVRLNYSGVLTQRSHATTSDSATFRSPCHPAPDIGDRG